MNIYLNGEKTEVPEACTAAQLIEQLGLAGRRIAMEANGEIVPRSTYEQHRFNPDDTVELVHAIGGGQTKNANPISRYLYVSK